MTIYELSIVIPCYNEDKNIYPLFEKIKKLLEDNNFTEIIIVDNGSTDNTYENVMSSNLYKENKINILKIEKNIGYGHGIMSGVNIAQGQCIGWCHADLQTEPADVVNAYIGMSLFASVIFQKKINDINAQPKLFLRSFLSYVKDYPVDFSLDLYLLVIAKTNNYRIINHEVIMKKRLFGEAKGGGNFIGKLKLIKRTFTYIIELRRKLWNL